MTNSPSLILPPRFRVISKPEIPGWLGCDGSCDNNFHSNSLFEQLKDYAQLTGHTISDVIEKQLRILLNAKTHSAEKSKPVSSKLWGIVSLPADFDYKTELQNRTLE